MPHLVDFEHCVKSNEQSSHRCSKSNHICLSVSNQPIVKGFDLWIVIIGNESGHKKSGSQPLAALAYCPIPFSLPLS